jgi:two-component system heavy metal sensor histidine kinase CusS
MRPAELWRRSFARADLQTAWIIGAVVALAFSISGAVFYAHAAKESLEEADHWFEFVLQVTERDLRDREPTAIPFDSMHGGLPDAFVALQVRGADGRVVFSRGSWPSPDAELQALAPAEHRERSYATALRVRRGDYLVGARRLSSGRRLTLAMPLAHFRSELAEVGRALLGGSLVAGAIAILIGLGAALRAFSPLRRATELLRGIDARSLGRRLPSRGTGDPIDLHAETLNRVLEGIDASFERLRAFSSDVAHELRTPLNRITNVTEVALLSDSSHDFRTALETVRATVEQLSRVVKSLLLLAEIDDRRLALRTQRFDAKPWVERSMDAYAAPFEEAGISLVSHCDAATIDGDRTLLDRVLANLLDNALAHAPPGSRVELAVAQRDGQVAISVDDAGPGIPPADRERVFDRFARLPSAASHPGHGLGLALARAIVGLHGGHLRVVDSPLGGARFEARLPSLRAAGQR